MKNCKKVKKNCLTPKVKVIEQDLSGEQYIDSVAVSILECIKGKVSLPLYELLKDMMVGFNEDMQLEIADDLLDFTNGHVIHTTGCMAVDSVLRTCYALIANEQGISLVFTNKY